MRDSFVTSEQLPTHELESNTIEKVIHLHLLHFLTRFTSPQRKRIVLKWSQRSVCERRLPSSALFKNISVLFHDQKDGRWGSGGLSLPDLHEWPRRCAPATGKEDECSCYKRIVWLINLKVYRIELLQSNLLKFFHGTFKLCFVLALNASTLEAILKVL